MTTQPHTARAHATLSPSSSHRWINCPGSVRATAGLPDETSSAAAEGTAAHELCAHCLTTGDDPGTFLDMWVDIHAKDGKARFVDLDDEPIGESAMRFFRIDDEMVDGVSLYVEHVRSLQPDPQEGYQNLVEIEQRLDMTHLHPEIFGTGDATVYDSERQHLHVIDFKYGKGVVVEADENPQLLLYAAGAARRYHNQQIAKLTIWVVQPRASHPAGPIRKYEIDLLDLFDFEHELTGYAKATDAPEAPFKAGYWCHDTFCKLQATCPANRAYRLEMAGAEFGEIDIDTKLPAVAGMTPAQKARVLREADGLLSYVKAVQEHMHAEAVAGRMPDDFKLVAKRANRKWKSDALAKDELYGMGATNDDILTEPKLRSPAQLEHLFPGKNKDQRQAAMADLVEKKSSGVNLVPASDPRPAVHVGASADFDAVEVA